MPEFNIYCDESCYLEKDQNSIMVLGALICPKESAITTFKRIREIKVKHNIPRNAEIKWHKVSSSNASFYIDLIDLYFDLSILSFRALIIKDKSDLDHKKFNQTHNDFYYKMYFELLKVLFDPKSSYNIYLDIKDTKGGEKVKMLHKVLCSSLYDFDKRIVKQIQLYKSDQIELIQLCDLLIGAIGYYNRNLGSNLGKTKVVNRIKERSGYSLKKTTLLQEKKMNLFFWDPNFRKTE